MYFSTKALSVGYDGKPLIENINIELDKGEILTLIGPNGAGKSTILKTIARQLSPIAGVAYIDGKDIQSISGKDFSKVTSALFTRLPEAKLMTSEEIVESGRYPYTGTLGLLRDKDHAKVAEVMELTDITDIADRDFSTLSDGQKKRVMLARALCQEPQVLILDEPTSYLDMRYKLDFMNTLQNMARLKNLIVIMSLHEVELARIISHKVLCVKGDCIYRYGTTDEVFTEDLVASLFDIESGNITELAKPTGTPCTTFVISGAGATAPIMRHLQRENTPFYAGIVYENDLDYPVVKALACEYIAQKPFEKVTDEQILRAKHLIDKCDKVYSQRAVFPELEYYNLELYNYAKKFGRLCN